MTLITDEGVGAAVQSHNLVADFQHLLAQSSGNRAIQPQDFGDISRLARSGRPRSVEQCGAIIQKSHGHRQVATADRSSLFPGQSQNRAVGAHAYLFPVDELFSEFIIELP